MRQPPGGRGFAVAVFFLLAAALPLQAQQPGLGHEGSGLNPPEHPVFGHTIMYGTGYIMTPHAFVPEGTSFFGTGVAIIAEDVNDDLSTFGRGAVGVGLGGILEVGVSSLNSLDRYAAFGKLQILRQSGIFPALAVGVQNLTTADSAGRYGLSDPFRTENIRDAASFYGVFSYVAGPGGTSFPSWVVISGGWGSGLYLQDVASLNDDGNSGGVFGSLALDFQAAEQAFLRVVVEHDGFDTNVGVGAYLAGFEVMAGALSIDEGSTPEPLIAGEPADPTREGVGFIYNQTKPFISVSLDLRALNDFPWVWGGDDEE